MQPSQWEIVVLKPSPAFLTFIGSQLPNVILPEFRLLQTDNTSYVFQRQNSDEELLDEIERQYSKMFKHEIERWLGQQVYQDVKASFLDFLCCFKFELHSNLLVMEDSLLDGSQMMAVKPRTVFLKWVHANLQEMAGADVSISTKLDLSQWAENGTVVVKNLENVQDLKSFLRLNYYAIYEAEMQRMCDGLQDWLLVDSYQMFSRYFVVDMHTQLVHLMA